MYKITITAAIASSLCFTGALSAAWELVDDFESNSLEKWTFGNRLDRQTPETEWDSSWGIVNRPFDGQGGLALAASPGFVHWQYLDVGIDLGPMSVDVPYTLYYEIGQTDLTLDIGAGLQPDTPEFWWSVDPNDPTKFVARYDFLQYGPIHRMGRVNLNVRSPDGTAYSAPYSNEQQAQTFYKFWLVVYPGQFSWDLWTQGGEFAEQTKVTNEVSGGYMWRNLTFDPLRTWRMRLGGANTTTTISGAPIYLDNFYIDKSGLNLSDPPISSSGETRGPGIFSDFVVIDGAVDTGDWLGWVYIEAYPFAYLHTLNTWIYAPEASPSVSGNWFFVFR